MASWTQSYSQTPQTAGRVYGRTPGTPGYSHLHGTPGPNATLNITGTAPAPAPASYATTEELVNIVSNAMDFSALRNQMQNFHGQVEDFIADQKRAMLDRLNAMEKSKEEEHKTKEMILKEIKDKKALEVELIAAISRERTEDAEVKSTLAALQTQKRSIQERLKSLEADAEEWRVKLAQRQEAYAESNKSLRAHTARNGPEIELLTQALGLQITSPQMGLVTFLYTNINPQDVNKPYSITVDISSSLFQIHSHNPPLLAQLIEAHLKALNGSGAFLSFLKNIRKSFVQLAHSELGISQPPTGTSHTSTLHATPVSSAFEKRISMGSTLVRA